MASLKTNVIWNVVRVGANMLFPIFTLPYINRVLGAYNIGLYNYINSIVSYFILFASLGFPLYGTREVTKLRDYKEQLENKVNSIFSANLLSAFLFLIGFLIFARIGFDEHFSLCLILGSSVILSSISFEWFFQGIEEFRYITIRSLIFKAISVLCLFIFVKDRTDILIYAIINIFAVFGSNIVNCWKLNHYLSLKFKLINWRENLKGASLLFVGSIIASLYTHINAVMLGTLGSVVAVAYYTTGDKFIQMCLQIMNAFSTAIIPRISYLNNNTNRNYVHILQKKILNIIFLFTIPMCIGLHVSADEIIMIFAGREFYPATNVLKWLSIIVVLIPVSIFFAFQVLYPIGKEKYSNYSTIAAASSNIIINSIFIPILSYKAVIISILISEGIVVIMHYYYSRKYIKLKIGDLLKYKMILAAIISGIVASIVVVDNNIVSAILKASTIIIVYPLLLCVMKEETIYETMRILKMSINK